MFWIRFPSSSLDGNIQSGFDETTEAVVVPFFLVVVCLDTLTELLHLPPFLLHLKQLQDDLTHTAECKDSLMDLINYNST